MQRRPTTGEAPPAGDAPAGGGAATAGPRAVPAESSLAGAARVVAAGMLWGTTGTSQALAPPSASPLTVGAVRMAIGGAALLALAAWRRALGPFDRRAWRALVAGGACMAAYQPLFFAGVARAGVAVGTLVGIGSAPVVAGLLGAAVRRERPGPRWFAATALALLGALLLVGPGRELAGVDPGGVALAVGAGSAYAAYTVATKALLERYPPDGVTGVAFALAAALLSPVLLFGDLAWLGEGRGAAVALHLGLVATAAAYVLFVRGLARLPVATAATLSLSEPMTAAVLGFAVLGERLAARAWAGVGLIAAALVLLALPGRRDAGPSRQPRL